MTASDPNTIEPHQTALFAGFFLAGASVLFGLIAMGIMWSGNTSFGVLEFASMIENKYHRIMIFPFVSFFGGYAFAFMIVKGIERVAKHMVDKDHEL